MLASSRDIEYFLEAASTLNFCRAAERLGISQPSLSLAIQRVEKSLGAKVFLRAKTGVSITKAGEQLLIHSKKLLQSWEDVRHKAMAAETEPKGTCTIGMHAAVSLYTSGNFIPGLLAAYPKLNIKLVHDLSRKIVEQIVTANIDIGLVINPIKHPDLIINKLCTDVVTLWNSNSPNKHNQDITNGHAVLICDPELSQSQHILKHMKKANIRYDRVISTNNLELIAELTIKGAGISILPTRLAKFISPTKLQKIEKAPIYKDELCLVYRVESKNIKTIQVVKDQIKNLFSIDEE